jgi:PGF-CTERM protein
MPRTTSTLPDDLHQLIEGSVDAGIFENKSDAIRHALRNYFEEQRTLGSLRPSISTTTTKSVSGRRHDYPVCLDSICRTSSVNTTSTPGFGILSAVVALAMLVIFALRRG